MNQLEEIVAEVRGEGAEISNEEVEDVRKFCIRKMEVANVKNREEYLPLLFADEIKHYLFRRYVNATTILRMMGEVI